MKNASRLGDVVDSWLRASRAARAALVEAELDRAVRDTFPASDPIPPGSFVEQQAAMDEIVCTLEDGRLTLAYIEPGIAPADADARLDVELPDGQRACVYLIDRMREGERVPAPQRSSETELVDRPRALPADSDSAMGAWSGQERRSRERRGADRRTGAH